MSDYLNSQNDFKKSNGCFLCPRKCGALRNDFSSVGVCKVPNDIYISKFGLHKWEEPCISGNRGSGTIFFYGCNLKCIYCQNYKISNFNHILSDSEIYTIESLSNICLELMKRGANNINFVTGTPYIPQIVKSIKLAKANGLNIPIVWNTSGYESIESLKILKDVVDIFLTDFRYIDNNLALKFSNVDNYVEVVKASIDYMVSTKGNAQFEKEDDIDVDLMKKGVIVRVLILPSHTKDTKNIIKYIYEKYKDNVYISIMSQYTPIRNDFKYVELNRKLTSFEVKKVLDYAIQLNISNAFIQDLDSANSSFIPNFDNKYL